MIHAMLIAIGGVLGLAIGAKIVANSGTVLRWVGIALLASPFLAVILWAVLYITVHGF